MSFSLIGRPQKTVMFVTLLLLLPAVKAQESTLSNYITRGNHNRLPFNAVQFLKPSKPTKKGPILFPNDGPPPPPTPLIVTSRPLIESIRRSELNPNNTIQAQSQINPITSRPGFFARYKNLVPFFNVATVTPVYQVDQRTKKWNGDQQYFDYEDAVTPHPIYRAFSEHTNDVLSKQTKPIYGYQENSALNPLYRGLTGAYRKLTKTFPVYSYQVDPKLFKVYREKAADQEQSKLESNHGENYAFSYTVKDRSTGDDYSHTQQSKGSATNGEYRVRLPDGRMQIVSYTADENGYKADVRYDDNDEHYHADAVPAQKQYTNANSGIEDKKITYATFNDNYKFQNRDGIYFDYADSPAVFPKGIHDYNARIGEYLLADTKDYLDQYNRNLNINPKVLTTYNVYKPQNHDNDYYSDDTAIGKDSDSVAEYKDYSTEFDYQPHKTKYTNFAESKNAEIKSSDKPYILNELNQIFSTKVPDSNNALVSSTAAPVIDSHSIIPLVSSTLAPYFEYTTQKSEVRSNTPTLFTNIKNILAARSLNSSPATPISPAVSTPSSYLYSTIANLKSKINPLKTPQLSSNFIDKINKYISYK